MYIKLRKNICISVLIAFLVNTLGPLPLASAQEFRGSTSSPFHLPKPGVMVHLSPPLNPAMLKGIKVHTDNPFRFDFILDKGDSDQSNDQIKEESSKLIKYFLASLTIPEKDLWVNLSPYEKDRIIPNSFGLTEMGRDLLAEDYMLKQITASLIYPEDEVGKKFWKRIYEEAQAKYHTTNIPVNTFNKVWIVPEKAVVYENASAGTAYVVESKLKVMLEGDYLAMDKNNVGAGPRACPECKGQPQGPAPTDTNIFGNQIIREIVIPELTKEINENQNFAQLRQVYNSLILATWYKKKIKDSILSQVYADKNKTQGIEYNVGAAPSGRPQQDGDHQQGQAQGPAPTDVELIYQRYLSAFKKGVYNYIKEEQDPITQQAIPRKYFSGGFSMRVDQAMTTTSIPPDNLKGVLTVTTDLLPDIDHAMLNQDQPLQSRGIPKLIFENSFRTTEEIFQITGRDDVDLRQWLSPEELEDLRFHYQATEVDIKNALETPFRTVGQSYGLRDTSDEMLMEVDVRQNELIRKDFEQLIRRKKIEGNLKITLFQIGLGRQGFIETRDIFEELIKAFHNAGITDDEMKNWKIDYFAMDVKKDVIDRFVRKFRIYTHFETNIKAVVADALIEDQMKILGQGNKADYIFFRNAIYANQIVSKGYLQIDQLKGWQLTELKKALNFYLGTKNVLANLSAVGTRYILEPAVDYGLGVVFHAPGTRILTANYYDPTKVFENSNNINNIGTGIYEIVNSNEIAQRGIKFFIDNITHDSVQSSDQAMFTQDQLEKSLDKKFRLPQGAERVTVLLTSRGANFGNIAGTELLVNSIRRQFEGVDITVAVEDWDNDGRDYVDLVKRLKENGINKIIHYDRIEQIPETDIAIYYGQRSIYFDEISSDNTVPAKISFYIPIYADRTDDEQVENIKEEIDSQGRQSMHVYLPTGDFSKAYKNLFLDKSLTKRSLEIRQMTKQQVREARRRVLMEAQGIDRLKNFRGQEDFLDIPWGFAYAQDYFSFHGYLENVEQYAKTRNQNVLMFIVPGAQMGESYIKTLPDNTSKVRFIVLPRDYKNKDLYNRILLLTGRFVDVDDQKRLQGAFPNLITGDQSLAEALSALKVFVHDYHMAGAGQGITFIKQLFATLLPRFAEKHHTKKTDNTWSELFEADPKKLQEDFDNEVAILLMSQNVVDRIGNILTDRLQALTRVASNGELVGVQADAAMLAKYNRDYNEYKLGILEQLVKNLKRESELSMGSFSSRRSGNNIPGFVIWQGLADTMIHDAHDQGSTNKRFQVAFDIVKELAETFKGTLLLNEEAMDYPSGVYRVKALGLQIPGKVNLSKFSAQVMTYFSTKKNDLQILLKQQKDNAMAAKKESVKSNKEALTDSFYIRLPGEEDPYFINYSFRNIKIDQWEPLSGSKQFMGDSHPNLTPGQDVLVLDQKEAFTTNSLQIIGAVAYHWVGQDRKVVLDFLKLITPSFQSEKRVFKNERAIILVKTLLAKLIYEMRDQLGKDVDFEVESEDQGQRESLKSLGFKSLQEKPNVFVLSAKSAGGLLKQFGKDFIYHDNSKPKVGFITPQEDNAMIGEINSKSLANKGGIDLNAINQDLQIQNAGGQIKFNLDPAMLQQLQDAPGFVPVIINIEPTIDLKKFLGVY